MTAKVGHDLGIDNKIKARSLHASLGIRASLENFKKSAIRAV